MITQIRILTPACSFVRDPQVTALGNTIFREAIVLIDEIGFEAFNFKKLAARISSTEASVYRYFENKQQLLLFLDAWYWGWMGDRLKQETFRLENSHEKLKMAFQLLIKQTTDVDQFSFIDEEKLRRIIEREGINAIRTRNVKSLNSAGAFDNYKLLVEKVSKWITEVNPAFPYPNMLVTTLIEGAHLQYFFSSHLPELTNKNSEKDNVQDFFIQLIDIFIFQKHPYDQ